MPSRFFGLGYTRREFFPDFGQNLSRFLLQFLLNLDYFVDMF
jgi:hypothetical protein